MKKLFTLMAVAFSAFSLSAQTSLVKYNGEAELPTGVAISGTTIQATVKIHTNTDAVNCLKLANGYTTDNVYNGNAIVLTAEGGFQAGDTLKIAGAINNSDESKRGSVRAFTINGESIDSLAQSANFINSRLVNDDPEVQSLVLAADAETLYLGRQGNTGTCVTYIEVVRPAEVASELVLTLNAKPYTGYEDNCGNAIFEEWSDKVVIKNFDGTEGNDLTLTWDETGWNAINGSANPWIYNHNENLSWACAYCYVTNNYTGGTWTKEGGTFYIGAYLYDSTNADANYTWGYLYWTLEPQSASAISTVNAEQKSSRLFDLNGRTLNAAQGLMIRDGKVVLVK